ncbi:AIPR family protein [Polaromonas sp.]|uniref:AIPR family protein n=1 Tax=Polaromonas sp. TaxID=1869339 RepID=UPI003CB7E5A2
MNKIIESLLNDFRNQNSLPSDMSESDAFERFAAFIAVEPVALQTVSPQDFVVGEDGQPDIDFVVAIVNGVPVNDPDEIDALAETNKYIDAHFIFGQAKTSPGFDVKALGGLGDFVDYFVTQGSTPADNEKVNRFHEVWTKVFDHAKLFRDANPAISLFYVTSGSPPTESDVHFFKKITQIKKRLRATGNFGPINIDLLGAADIQKRYKQLTNQLSAELNFPKKVALGDIEKIKNAYVGVVPATEFLKLVVGAAGQVMQSVFYDNVRDWQGHNAVNSLMQETLKDPIRKRRFVVMNNGVTVIARKLRPVNDRLFLEDYQIVNGCQTSNVLARMDAVSLDGVMIPLRVMETSDDKVIRDVIQATNNQTEVTQPQLLAITDFQKGLEAFFATHSSPGLVYERRMKQYSGAKIDKAKIVTPLGLVKAVAATYRDEPHKTAREFSSLVKGLGISIFAENHKFEPYYVAALLNYWVEYFLRTGRITGGMRPARYQIMYAFKLFHQGTPALDLSSRAAARHADGLMKLLRSERTASDALDEPIKIAVRLMQGKGRTEPRTLAFTAKVRKSIEVRLNKLAQKAEGKK